MLRPARTTHKPSFSKEITQPRLPYLAGLDGLRALAVLAVLLYHGDMRWATGGFLGVEVFFVISGYLITALLLHEHATKGRIDLNRFYLRRARRLLPAAFVLILLVLTYAVLFLPEEAARLRGDAAAAFFYVTNWYLIFGERSYFETVGRPSLLQHLWSLAVEEQFYLLWPVVLTLLLGVGGRGSGVRRRGEEEKGRRGEGERESQASSLKPQASSLQSPQRTNPHPSSFTLHPFSIAIALLGAACSTLLMALLYRPGFDPSRIYYGTDTRATGLLLGAALAFVWRPGTMPRTTRLERLLLATVGALGLVVLSWLCWQANQFLPQLYRGGFLWVAFATTLIIAAVAYPRTPLISPVLGAAPLRYIGLRSYSIYLWHWPIFVLTRPQQDITLAGVPLLVLRFALTLVLAECSYRLVERPIRDGALERLWRLMRQAWSERRWEWLVRAAGVAVTSIAFCTILGSLLLHARRPATPPYLAVNAVTISSGTTLPEGRSVFAAARPTSTPTSTPTPSATATPTDIPPTALPTESPTPAPPTATPEPPTPTPQPKVFAIGDSVMLGAAGTMVSSYGNMEVDAAVSRQFQTGIDMLAWRRDNGLLGDVVVVQLGNNGPIDVAQFDTLMQVLKDVHRVLVLTVKVPRPWEASNNQIITAGVQPYPNAVLVDWYGASINNPGYFYDDGIHLVPDGAAAYTNLILANL